MKQISVHGSAALVGPDSAEALDLVQPKGCYAETAAALLSGSPSFCPAGECTCTQKVS